jgi:hypothetical protein
MWIFREHAYQVPRSRADGRLVYVRRPSEFSGKSKCRTGWLGECILFALSWSLCANLRSKYVIGKRCSPSEPRSVFFHCKTERFGHEVKGRRYRAAADLAAYECHWSKRRKSGFALSDQTGLDAACLCAIVMRMRRIVSAKTKTSELTIFARLLRNHKREMSPRLARYVLTLGFDTAEQSRMDELAARNQAGCLSADEHDELMSYVKAGHLLALMQSKARQALKNAVVC